MDDPANDVKGERSLQQVLKDYKQAFEEEFAKDADEINEDSEGIANKAKEVLVSCIPDAATTLAYLSMFATSETVRLQAAKYIMDNGLGKTGFASPADPLEELVKQLTANKPATPTDAGPSS